MTAPHNPWGRDRPGMKRRGRLVLWLVLIVLGGAVLLLLLRDSADPGLPDGWLGSALYTLVVLAFVLFYFLFSDRLFARGALRNVVIWTGIVAVAATAYTYRDKVWAVTSAVRSGFVPSYPVSAGPGTLVLTESEGGGFFVQGRVNDTAIRFLIDTGASDIVLSPADAKRLGIDLTALHFNLRFETANGLVRGARHVVQKLEIGPIHLTDVPVMINGAEMRQSLLGMTFLRRMASLNFEGHRLTITRR